MNTTTLNMTTLDGGVIIKKGTAPAPPSGESASTIEYLDFRNVPDDLIPQTYTLIGKFDINGNKMVVPSAMVLSESGANTKYMIEGAIDLECEVIVPAMGITSPTKLKDIPGLKEAYDSIPRITKEQFYSLD